MGSYYQGQDIADGTFVKLRNPMVNVDNHKSQFKNTSKTIFQGFPGGAMNG